MLSNAAAAAVLAVFAAALGYFVRAPAVRHAAWLLVTLKLVTPPIVSLPLPLLPASWAPQVGRASQPVVLACPTGWDARPTADAPDTGARALSLTDGLVLAWAAGALGWFAWQGRRIVRFRRRVRAAEDAPAAILAATTRIAKALGIGWPPAVKV